MISTTEMQKRATPVQNRNDRELLQNVKGALARSGYRELAGVGVQVEGNRVFLQGSVSSYYRKQVAQEVVKRVNGVEYLQNQIRVDSRNEPVTFSRGTS